MKLFVRIATVSSVASYLVDVLALKLREELLKALVISLNADRLEDGGDVLSGGAGVAAELEEEVSCQVLHFECLNPIDLMLANVVTSFVLAIGVVGNLEEDEQFLSSKNRDVNQFNREVEAATGSSSSGVG